VISRVADHCFWLGRYIERAESTARLLQVTRALAFDGDLSALQCWRPLVTVSGQYADFTERFGVDAAGHGEVVQQYMTWATENPVSVRNSVRAAREGARSIREVLSGDIWQATNELFLWFVGEEAGTQFKQDRDGLYRNVRKATQLCLGLVRSTMLHDTPMDFLWLGVLLERLGQTARILDMHHHMMGGTEEGSEHQDEHQIVQTALWLSLLRACSGFDAFMRQHQGRVSRAGVVSFQYVAEPHSGAAAAPAVAVRATRSAAVAAAAAMTAERRIRSGASAPDAATSSSPRSRSSSWCRASASSAARTTSTP